MQKPVIIAGIAAVVALSVAAIAFAASTGGGSDAEQSSGSNGGGAAGACPAAGVPGISEEERERCFEQDSPGGAAPPAEETPAEAPVTDDDTPVAPGPPVSDTPSSPGANPPPLPADRRAEEAPIDGLDIRVAESFPPQYFLNVQAGLPSGCAEQYTHEVARDGSVITVTVLNSMPAAQDAVCTMIYGMYELNIALGSDFDSGETYTVRVNDQEISFTAQ